MRTRLRTTALRATEWSGVLLLLWAVASHTAGADAGVPVWAAALIAGSASAVAVPLAARLWLATIPSTTAAARAVPPTLFGTSLRVAGHGRTPLWELLGALATPVALALASGAYALAAWHAGSVSPAAAAALEGVATALFLLASVTLAPGLPFDGGRVLRAVIWWWTGDVSEATRFAASAGQGLATLMMIAGAASGLAGDVMTGAVLLTAGVMVHLADTEGFEAVDLVESARGLRVRDAMHPAVCTLGRGTSMAEALERYAAMGGPPVFPVLDGRSLAGVVTLKQAQRTPPAQRPDVTADQIMTPASELAAVQAGDWLSQALNWRVRSRGYALVVTGGQLAGLVLADGRWPVQAQPAVVHEAQRAA